MKASHLKVVIFGSFHAGKSTFIEAIDPSARHIQYTQGMFRKNSKHQQPAFISAASELPEKQSKRLEKSWAGTFYKEFFSRIDEQSFAVLYSEKDSRPNVPVNVLVGLEALKARFGWSDQELYENYCYDLQVRYALGYD